MKDLIARYGKFVVAALAAGAGSAYMYLDDSHLTGQEWVLILLAALGAVGVAVVPNKPAATKAE